MREVLAVPVTQLLCIFCGAGGAPQSAGGSPQTISTALPRKPKVCWGPIQLSRRASFWFSKSLREWSERKSVCTHFCMIIFLLPDCIQMYCNWKILVCEINVCTRRSTRRGERTRQYIKDTINVDVSGSRLLQEIPAKGMDICWNITKGHSKERKLQ